MFIAMSFLLPVSPLSSTKEFLVQSITDRDKASAAIKNGKTDSSDHFEQAQLWFKMCRDDHKLCRGVGNTKLERPTRMLYASGGKNWAPGSTPETLKLIQTSQMDSSAEYLALSHC